MCDQDGGYYAIKGFLYQFDKTMIEILQSNEDIKIYMERMQDIDYENYVVQVKHKETSTFSNSKVREPIIQLLELYKKDRDKKFCLYGYFSDQKPQNIIFSDVTKLDNILKYKDHGKTVELESRFPKELREGFIKNFSLCFAEDYKKQFNYLIDKIKGNFSLRDNDDAIIYHSLIRQRLLELAINPVQENRYTSKKELKCYIAQCNKKIFYGYYDEVLDREKYIKLIKKNYFTFKSTNINNYERLFIIESKEVSSTTNIRKIIDCIANKYYRKNKSPAPYICFKDIEKEILNTIKQEMIDDDVKFSDGTCFNGDKFRASKIKLDGSNNDIKVKIINENQIEIVCKEVCFKEYYNLFIENPTSFGTERLEINIQINELEEVDKMIG